MYKRILVPLDGSRLAEGILPFVVQIAGPLDLDVTLVRVEPPIAPHAIEVDGQIIKVYDPSIHKEVKSSVNDDSNNAIRKEALDRRYVACNRPIIITGGELTLEDRPGGGATARLRLPTGAATQDGVA